MEQVLKEAHIELDSGEVYRRLYKKIVKNDKKETFSKQEQEDRKIEVIATIGGPNADFDTCLITIVKQLVDESYTMSNVAFTYYVVWISHVNYFF